MIFRKASLKENRDFQQIMKKQGRWYTEWYDDSLKVIIEEKDKII